MADEITVKAAAQKQYAPCPVGSQPAVCVDIIDLGETVESYQNEAPRKSHKVALVFQADEENPDTLKRYEVSAEFTLSFGKKAKLRKFLGDWRGKPYSDAEAEAGAPLHKLEGVNAILNVQHKVSKLERVYAIIASIAPPMKGMPKLVPSNYERSAHWELRKADYRTLVVEHDKAHPVAAGGTSFEDFPPALETDDDLPF